MTTTDTTSNHVLTRGQKLWLALRERRDHETVSLERAKLLTDSYKETEGMYVTFRRAKAFEKIVTEIPIYIDDGQLLAGDFAAKPMSPEWYPEQEVEGIAKEIEDGKTNYMVAEQDMPLLKELCEYWKDRSLLSVYKRCIGEIIGDETVKEVIERAEEGAWIHDFLTTMAVDKGWFVPDYPKAIRVGLSGILGEVEEEIQATTALDSVSRDKVYFLASLRIVLKASMKYARRYSSLARKLAKQAKAERKAELERIAEVCSWVPDNPARSFYEAVQTLWFCHVLIHLDTRPNAVSLGRVDQYLYPYYKQDIEKGMLTREEAIEILECLRVKITSLRQFWPEFLRLAVAGEAEFHNCTLGGQTVDGRDAVNELSFLWIEAARRTRTPHPTLSVRVHENLSKDFAIKAAELCSLGLGYPAWFGDKTAIDFFVKRGHTLEEARDYALGGCVLHVIPHKTGGTWPILLNMPKILELALNDGVDPRTGKQFGPKTGKFGDLNYDKICEAFIAQSEYFLKECAQVLNSNRLFRSTHTPHLITSCFFDDCIKRGQDTLQGGCRYQQYGQYLLPIGLIDAVDSLAALKHRVFDEKSISKQELINALKENFEGKDAIRKLLLDSPKYGNDDDYADQIAADLYRWLSELTDKTDACYGAKFTCAPHNLSFHGATGLKVGALPSGRLAGVSLADGAVSPCQGNDTEGPTAVLKSAGKVNQVPLYGTLLNMKFNPSSLKTKEDLEKFVSLIKTYLIDLGGKHVQFNVIGKQTLIDAQAHPDRYRNLVVRVAGYSALWVELNPTMQNEIIARTEYSL